MNPSNSVAGELDSRLIQSCLAGEKAAWNKLVEKVSSFVYYCIHKVIRTYGGEISDEDIQDIFQNVFLALCKDNFKKLRSYGRKCKFTTWLSFVVRSVCVDYLRKEKKGSTISLDEPVHLKQKDENSAISRGDTMADKSEDVVSQLEQAQVQEIVHNVLDGLPSRERMIIRLFYEEGKKYREIAGIMDIPENTVASALSRVKASLKSKLKEKLGKEYKL